MNDLVYFYPHGHAAHYAEGHPERPERVEAICEGLRAAGWWDAYEKLEVLPLSKSALEKLHAPAYLDVLQTACRRGAWLDADTYTTPDSWQLAINAAGGAAAAALAVWSGASQHALALTRPPGHHATRQRGMGFCLLNNVAIAAQAILDAENPARRTAIIDLDLHHGNGTQDIFWQRKDVLYISTHQSPYYPGTGNFDEIGAGEGQGYTANFPLPPGTGDVGFMTFMEELILPLLDRCQPQILLVSLGFDPHWRDPLGHLALSATGLGSLMASLRKWAQQNCDGKMALFLEGGYDLEAAAACMQACVAALLEVSWQDPLGPSPRPEGNSWRSALRAAHAIWG